MNADEIPNVVLVIHGGAGTMKPPTPEIAAQLRADLERSLQAGFAALHQADGGSIDAVEAAIRVLEDSPLFNAGKGSVFTADGRNELDASIMVGKDKRAGAVAGVQILKNPIGAARAVMEKSPHVFLIGRSAELFAADAGLDVVDPSYFWTAQRWQELQTARAKAAGKQASKTRGQVEEHELGTVGAVAVDTAGNLAAGTSTGGMTAKRPGRVGDSPIIGAGTYADNQGCGVSCTGHGEFFIRYAVAHEIVSLVKYKGLSVSQATDEVIQRQLKPAGGEGAAIALDPRGNCAISFNADNMYRGYITKDGKTKVMIGGE